MSRESYYQRNRTVILNRAKDYYHNNIKELREKAKNKYRELSSKEKNIKRQYPLDGTHLVAVRRLTTKMLSTQERQREELVGASLLRPIRTNRSSLTCRCQFPESR